MFNRSKISLATVTKFLNVYSQFLYLSLWVTDSSYCKDHTLNSTALSAVYLIFQSNFKSEFSVMITIG